MPSKRRICLRTSKAVDQETRENSDSNDKGKHKNVKNSDEILLDGDVKSFETLFLQNKLRQSTLKTPGKFIYLFSEHYENIEKLLNSIGKSLKVKTSIPEFKMAEEKLVHKIVKTKPSEIEKKTHLPCPRMKQGLSRSWRIKIE